MPPTNAAPRHAATVPASPLGRVGGRLKSRPVIAVLDQVMSSGSNILITVLAARVSTPVGFAKFSLLYAAYIFLLGVQRAAISEPMVITVNRRLGAKQATQNSQGASLSIVFGFAAVSAAVLVVIGALGGGALVYAGAVALPLALLQDAWRFAFISQQRFAGALGLDAVWLVVVLGAVGVDIATTNLTPAQLYLVWGAGALLCLPPALRHYLPHWSGVRSWVREHRELAWKMLVEQICGVGLAQLITFLLPLVATLEVIAGLRGAIAVAGPALSFFTAMSLVSLARISRWVGAGSFPTARRVAAKFALFNLAAGLLGALITVFVPERVGRYFLGATWDVSKHVVPVVLIAYTILGANQCWTFLLRSSGYGSRNIRLRLVATPTLIVIMLLGTWLFGLNGAAYGFLIGALITAVLWLRLVAWASRAETAKTPATQPIEPLGVAIAES